MASPNYSYQKRQRELAKKQKKEAKLARKNEKPATDDPDAQPVEGGDGADEAAPAQEGEAS